MLRVSYSGTEGGLRWVVCGRLVGPWVNELRSCWRHAREQAPRAAAVVDLSDVTFIDEAGEELLAEMQSAGTEIVAAGVENNYLLAALKKNGGHPRRGRVEHLNAPCEKPGAHRGGNE